MSVHHHDLRVPTGGEGEMHDLTEQVAELVSLSTVSNGAVVVFVPGSTAGVTTIEYEPGLLEDFPALMERLAPRKLTYAHDQRWHDGNGHAHVRASLLGPSLTVPIVNGEMALGTWQQIALVDFDNRARERRVLVTILGE
ncbi:MAG: YjbQ family protein [Candidatus Eisenbacteria bacterium]|uniref:YjbQ family protein n=1 Tax=Eiseniibacteriota bacterium TaxID=2212470 RepID=A0A538TYR8_UNCEI|nr:MAG: YjbQ family protein [Candidatus Eisenbacteria bacterium]